MLRMTRMVDWMIRVVGRMVWVSILRRADKLAIISIKLRKAHQHP
jgi:hypothetical protein